MSQASLLRIYERHFNPTLALLFDLAGCPVEARAQGVRVFDEQGRTYLDFASGYGVFGIGHLHPRVQAAVQHQLSVLAVAPSLLPTPVVAEFMAKLAGLLPGDLRRILFAGSGSEAVELALRTALLARPRRGRLIAATNSYHGKTLGALCVMGQDHLRAPFEPLGATEVEFVPFGDAAALARAVGNGALAVILEPILGGGHLTVPPDGYLTEVRALCDRTRTLLIIDEVQTGFGRTGTLFAIDREHIIPDIVILSKGITGGHVPIAVAAVGEHVLQEGRSSQSADLLACGERGGSPLVCAAASAAIDVIVGEDLPRRAAESGAVLLEGLGRSVASYPAFAMDAPGRGLMTGLKLRSSILEHALWMQMLKRGVITGLSTNFEAANPVLRFFPPLTVGTLEIQEALDALDDSLKELSVRPSLLYRLANEALRARYYLPRGLLRLGSRFLG